jgi:hypothetical protein
VTPAAAALTLDAARVRRILLARAVEEADTDGRLVSAVEREQLERAALQAVPPDPDHPGAPEPAAYLDERARRILEVVERRDARTAAVQHAEAWQRRLAWGLPAVALVLGAGLERIDNPQQVNMLSPPLLAFVAWNLLVYLVLLIALVRRGRPAEPGRISLLDWLSQPRGRSVQAAVAARFHALWWRIAGTLEGLRLRQVLHASAAAWAVGVGLSIVVGGLVREYRIGWESTLLDLPQVHALLRALFAPVAALLPVEGFTLEQLERMHFRSGAPVGQAEARHWITLYLGLLLLAVVIPRALLAAWAGVRRGWQGRAVRLDLADPYFDAVLGRVSPARVRLAWAASGPVEREAILRLWREACDTAAQQPPAAGTPWPLLRSPQDDELAVVEWVPEAQAAPAAPPAASVTSEGSATSSPNLPVAAGRWLDRIRQWAVTATAPQDLPPAHAQVQLLVVALPDAPALESLMPRLRTLERPVVLLASGTPDEASAMRSFAAACHLQFDLLPLHQVAACWAWEAPLHQALVRHLPPWQAPGAARLRQAWAARHSQRLAESMQLLAAPLAGAAREVEEAGAGPLSLRRLVDASQREASQQARQDAMARLLQRVGVAQAYGIAELRRLHGLVPIPAAAFQGGEDRRFFVNESVDTPQAGMAGAASGAAAGATIDIFTGGLTLGAAAALGALVGGAGGLVAAALKNRGVPGAGTQVRLADEMLQALVEITLLQYLAVVHRAADPEAPVPPAWRREVVAVVTAGRDHLNATWHEARAGTGTPAALPGLLADQARELLARLRPVT